MNDDRRKFSRVPFKCEARLFLPDGEDAVELLDLSLKGALVKPESPLFVRVGTHGVLTIRLDSFGTHIRMEATVVYPMAGFYGLACREIDLDSITHLRRLVELNLGAEALAEREFSLLTQHPARAT